MSKYFIPYFLEHFMTSNPLHIDLFTSTTQMEAELVSWAIDIAEGEKPACGVTTSGGTESLITSVLAYRDWGR